MRFGSLASFVGVAVGASSCHSCDGFVSPGAARPLPPSSALWNDRERRGLNEFGHDYTQAGGPIDRGCCTLPERDIHALLCARQRHRRARDFQTADAIVQNLNRRGVRVDDARKQWRADGRPLWRAEKRRLADPNMRNCKTLEETVDMAYGCVYEMSPRGISAFWSLVSKFLQQRPRGGSRAKYAQLDRKLSKVLSQTLESIDAGSFKCRDLATVAISWAKIVNNVNKRGETLPGGGQRRILHNLLVAGNSTGNRQSVFQNIARASMPILQDFDARSLSNLIYAFGLVEYVPEFEAFYDILAEAACTKLERCEPQGLCNIAWSYAKVNTERSDLFQQLGDRITALGSLESFKPQGLSNIAWAYKTAKEPHPELFEKVATHIITLDTLERFKPQELSNIAWAYATAKDPSPKLFEKVASHIIALKSLNRFTPQTLSNVAWAYATANEPHPTLFEKVATHILELNTMNSFTPQALSNIAWAYATANEPHPKLFKKVAGHIIGLKSWERFKPQELSTIAWAYATAKESHPKLFERIASHIIALNTLDQFKPQELSNIAWAYATANEPQPELFERVADHVLSPGSLETFIPENLSNIAWAYTFSSAASHRAEDPVTS